MHVVINALCEAEFYKDGKLRLPRSARSYIDGFSHEASLLTLEQKMGHFGYLLTRDFPLYDILAQDIEEHMEYMVYSTYDRFAKMAMAGMLSKLHRDSGYFRLINDMTFKEMFDMVAADIRLCYTESHDLYTNELCFSFLDYEEAIKNKKVNPEIHTAMNDKNFIVSLQTILAGRNAEFDAATNIKLIRHKDNRPKKERIILGQHYEGSLYTLYRHERQRFLDYQSEQRKGSFDNVQFIVSCLGEEGTLTRFLGVYRVLDKEEGKSPDEALEYYNMEELPEFDVLKERLIFDWGKGTVNWCVNYHSNEKNVVAITRSTLNEDGIPAFVSYSDTNLSFGELKSIIVNEPSEWKNRLEAVNCIYLIQDTHNGKQYIGSTYNRQGIWSRWKEYAETNGHGNDIELKKMVEADPNYSQYFHWTILEVLPFNITENEAVERESMYKDKFMTRQFGYNKN